MKKTLAVLAVLAVFMAVVPGTSYADEYDNLFTHRLYLGIGSMPFEVTGLPNMDLTDRYTDTGSDGIGVNPPDEGRIALDLADKEASGYHVGFNLGYEFLIAGQYGIVAELGFYSLRQEDTSGAEVNNDSTLITGYLGFEYRFINSEFFYVGFLPKIGFVHARLDFGETVDAVLGAPPVFIYKDGNYNTSVNAGQPIAVTITGFSAQALLTAGLRFGPVEVFAQGGVTYAAFGDFDVEFGNAKVPSSSKQFVQPETYTTASPDPEISSVGAFIQVGAALNL